MPCASSGQLSHDCVISFWGCCSACAWWLALTLSFTGVLGLLIALGAARGSGSNRELSADASGLSELTSGEWCRQVTWDAITDFYVRHDDGGRNLYLAIRKAEFPVLWSAGERSRAAGTVMQGRQYISRDEFAAVVAQRVGKPLKALARVRKNEKSRQAVDAQDR
jgi:hypothetical protein